jgi:hypothetical protein
MDASSFKSSLDSKYSGAEADDSGRFEGITHIYNCFQNVKNCLPYSSSRAFFSFLISRSQALQVFRRPSGFSVTFGKSDRGLGMVQRVQGLEGGVIVFFIEIL